VIFCNLLGSHEFFASFSAAQISRLCMINPFFLKILEKILEGKVKMKNVSVCDKQRATIVLAEKQNYQIGNIL